MELVPAIHFLLFIINSFYAFLFSKNRFDLYYLLLMFLTGLSWTLCKGECILSVIYKKYKDPNYKIGENRSVDDLTTLFGEKYKPYMEYLNKPIMAVQSYNVYLVLQRNQLNVIYAFLYFIYILGLSFTSHALFQGLFFFIFLSILIKIVYKLWR